MSSGKKIARLVSGQVPSLLDAKKGNELIDALNALQNIQIRYGEYFKASYGTNGVTLTIPRPPEEVEETSTFDDYELLTMKVCINGEVVERDFFVTIPEE